MKTTTKQQNYLDFRSKALQSLSLLKPKDQPKWNRDDQEKWIASEYKRHNKS